MDSDDAYFVICSFASGDEDLFFSNKISFKSAFMWRQT